MKTILRKSLPSHVAKILGRKRSVFVSVTASPVACTGTMWQGGSRSSWHELPLAGGFLSTPTYVGEGTPLPFGNVQRNAQPRVGVAIVEMGTFCGKPATPHIYLHPEDATLLGV
jgi:hypothetical protein